MELSVVVTIVDAGAALERCLAALEAQERSPAMEVLVPWDASVDVSAARERFRSVRFLELGALAIERPIQGEAGRHELYDRRRSAGLSAARGELVALLEDRGAPRPGWARTVAALHARRPEPAIGGAIECASPGLLGRAVYLCDFGRYALPREEGSAGALSDTNVSYKRAALEAVRASWEPRFHEPRVHAALGARGGLWFSPELVVDQRREHLSGSGALAERFHWGRLFGAERCSQWSAPRRAAWAVAAPFLPPLLWLRVADQRLARTRHVPGFLAAGLALGPLLAAWSLGEAVGYATGR